MDPRSYWNHYVSQHGGPAGTARRLGIPFQTIASICNGNRGIGRKTARRMAEQDPLLAEKILIWVTAADAPAARNPAARSEESRVGKAGVSKGGSRGSPYH